jgi:hypothetical protein
MLRLLTTRRLKHRSCVIFTIDPQAKTKRQVASIAAAVGLVFAGSERSWSDENIGDAKIVINSVAGRLSSGSDVPVVVGGGIFLNEAVNSDVDSKADLLLKDNTKVTIGPTSTVKLANFIYSGPKQPGTIVLNFSKGTLRFVTGDASKRAYMISTPTAAIGVRGTILRIEVTPTETRVINEEGIAVVCHRPKGGALLSLAELQRRRLCQELLEPNTQATVTQNQIAVTEAPVDAITEPIINETELAGGGFTSPLAAGFTPPLAAAGIVGVAVIGGTIAASVSNNQNPQNPLSP